MHWKGSACRNAGNMTTTALNNLLYESKPTSERDDVFRKHRQIGAQCSGDNNINNQRNMYRERKWARSWNMADFQKSMVNSFWRPERVVPVRPLSYRSIDETVSSAKENQVKLKYGILNPVVANTFSPVAMVAPEHFRHRLSCLVQDILPSFCAYISRSVLIPL